MVDAHSPDVDVAFRIFEKAFGTGDESVVDEVCSPDLVEHQFGLEASGATALSNVKAAIRDLRSMVPDISFTLEDAAQSGEKVWLRVRAEGTATGPFFGPPSGRPVSLSVMDVMRVVDGRIVEHWGVPDRFAMLLQTGVLDRLRPA